MDFRQYYDKLEVIRPKCQRKRCQNPHLKNTHSYIQDMQNARKNVAVNRFSSLLDTSHLSGTTEAFYYAVKQGNAKYYSTYLEKGVSIDASLNKLGHTALHIAVIIRNKPLVLDLVNRGTDWKAKDINGACILHTIIDYKPEDMNAYVIDSMILYPEDESDDNQRKIIEILTIFLDLGLDVDSKDFNHRTPLFIALEKGMKKVAEFLIDRGANVNHCMKKGDTFLHHLVTFANEKNDFVPSSRYTRFVTFLISKGVNVDSVNNDGYSALDLAVKYNLEDVTFILLQYVNNVTLKLNNRTILHIYVEFICREKIADLSEKCEIPSNINVYNVIEKMIKKGASVDAADAQGNSPLRTAVDYCTDEKLILLLLQNLKNVNKLIYGKEPLLHLVIGKYIGHPDKRSTCINVLKDLVRRGANVNKPNKERLTMIQIAIINNFIDIFRILKEKADFNVLTDKGLNVIHLASKTAEVNSEIIDHLLMRGFDVTAPTKKALTPIHLAARSGNLVMINCLLDQGVDVNCREEGQQRTPLHIAAEASSAKTIEFLVEKGADINARDANGATALIKTNCHPDLICRMIKLGAEFDVKDGKGRNLLEKILIRDGDCSIKRLLKFGLDVNQLNYRAESEDKVNIWFKHVLKGSELYEQIVKLELADLPVPEIFQLFIGIDDPQDISDYFKMKKKDKFLAALKRTRHRCKTVCWGEIEKMQTHLFNGITSIYDFLRMTPTRQIAYVNNDNLTKLVSFSSSIENEFPEYCGIIRATYDVALKRQPLVEPAYQALCQICDSPLPDLCVEHIFDYLSNEDLKSIIASSNE